MKFTDRKILSLRPRESRYEEWEGNGLGIRVFPTGRKSWVFLYRFQDKNRRMTLGRYPGMTVAGAHKAHGDALADLEKGIDPGSVRVEANQEERKAPTVAVLAAEYMEKWAKPRKRSWQADQRLLDRDVLPAWGRRKAKDIKRRDVIQLLDDIVDRGAPIGANRVLALVRKMYNFGIGRDLVGSNPCLAVKAPSQENRRDRVLTETEIRTLWLVLDRFEETGEGMEPGTALALKLQLLTAQRKGECASAEWSEVDTVSGWWTIPAEKSKNKIPHRVPLSPQSLEVLDRIKVLSGESPWLFPSRMGQKRHISDNAIDRAVRNNRESLGVEHFTPHDLRRTAASLMTAAGISRLVVSKILNHVESGITAVYDRHSYDSEKRQALELWGRKLEQIVEKRSADNVISLRTPA